MFFVTDIVAISLAWMILELPRMADFPSRRPENRNFVGYLGVFFLGSEPYVYFDLSNGNDALSYTPLNGGQPILKPSIGTGGVRDPSIVQGSGSEEGRRWYLIGTDLDIDEVGEYDLSISRGSLRKTC